VLFEPVLHGRAVISQICLGGFISLLARRASAFASLEDDSEAKSIHYGYSFFSGASLRGKAFQRVAVYPWQFHINTKILPCKYSALTKIKTQSLKFLSIFYKNASRALFICVCIRICISISICICICIAPSEILYLP